MPGLLNLLGTLDRNTSDNAFGGKQQKNFCKSWRGQKMLCPQRLISFHCTVAPPREEEGPQKGSLCSPFSWPGYEVKSETPLPLPSLVCNCVQFSPCTPGGGPFLTAPELSALRTAPPCTHFLPHPHLPSPVLFLAQFSFRNIWKLWPCTKTTF